MTGPADRPGRRALFSVPGAGIPDGGPGAAPPDGTAEPPKGRRALFSDPEPDPAAPPRGGAVVHCRTCLAATPLPLVQLLVSLTPSLWLPTRPWSRLMRCPACRRVSWCRVEWSALRP